MKKCGLVFIAVLLVLSLVGVYGCQPLSGVIVGREVLLIDTRQSVSSPKEALDLVQANLTPINAIKLIRIPGRVDNSNIKKLEGEEIERNGVKAYRISVEYLVGNETGKLTLTVTVDGKIYGYTNNE